MRNLAAFKLACNRAQRREEARTKFDDSEMCISVPTQVLLVAKEHIIDLEKRVAALELELRSKGVFVIEDALL